MAPSKAYVETDAPNPVNVYGKTKLAGDQAIQAVGGEYLILRTSWVYGARGSNFLLTMLRLARNGRSCALWMTRSVLQPQANALPKRPPIFWRKCLRLQAVDSMDAVASTI